ncbi:hypothetical protein J6590_068071 [Homalodisca vitripennis]|nr:hypothetical protein J6590_068071 [Homalodisca vitripennis]
MTEKRGLESRPKYEARSALKENLHFAEHLWNPMTSAPRPRLSRSVVYGEIDIARRLASHSA